LVLNVLWSAAANLQHEFRLGLHAVLAGQCNIHDGHVATDVDGMDD